MSSKNFFMAILSHKKSTHREAQRKYLLESNKVLESYGKGKFFIYYFIGDPSISKEYEIDEETNTVFLRVPDNYESLPQKTHGAIKFAYDNFRDKIEGMIKTDDDIQIELDKAHGALSAYGNIPYFGITTKITNPENFSSWHMGKCESAELNNTPIKVPLCHYCAGGGYYLSPESMQRASSQGEVYRSMIFEDAATGYVLNSYGIYPQYLDMGEFGFNWPGMNPVKRPIPSTPGFNPLTL